MPKGCDIGLIAEGYIPRYKNGIDGLKQIQDESRRIYDSKKQIERKQRVVETARMLFVAPEHPDSTSTWDDPEVNKKLFEFMLALAEQFEAAAEKYLKGEE